MANEEHRRIATRRRNRLTHRRHLVSMECGERDQFIAEAWSYLDSRSRDLYVEVRRNDGDGALVGLFRIRVPRR